MRQRLTILLVCSMGLLLLGTGMVLHTVITSQLGHEFDRALLAKAQALITLTSEEDGVVELDFVAASMPEFRASERPEYFALWAASGSLIAKSSSLGEQTLPRLSTLRTDPVFQDITLVHGHRGRLVQIAFVPHIDDDNADEQAKKQVQAAAEEAEVLDPTQYPHRAAVLTVARDRTQLDTLLKHFRLALAAVICGVLLGMVGLVRVMLRIGLRPLVDVQRQVAQLDASSLHAGIQVRTHTRELAPVVEQLNRLLQRLDAAFAQERQFSSAVAHELRTPLTELRTLTEVSMRWQGDRAAVQQYFTDAHDICLHMERIVVTLLTLKDYESGTQWIHCSEIKLSELVEACWHTVKHAAHEKALTLQCDIPASCTVHMDRDILTVVVSNLLDNAVAYSPSQGQVRCVTASHGRTLQLTISNPAANLTADDMAQIFERFWRKDPARSDERHLGLGLAIVKACSEILDLHVQANLDAQRLFSISLSFARP